MDGTNPGFVDLGGFEDFGGFGSNTDDNDESSSVGTEDSDTSNVSNEAKEFDFYRAWALKLPKDWTILPDGRVIAS